MTKKELQSELDAAGIEYPAKATNEELEALLASAQAGTDAPPADGGAGDESETDDGWKPAPEEIHAKMRAGLSRAQAIEVLRMQHEHDLTNPHDDQPEG